MRAWLLLAVLLTTTAVAQSPDDYDDYNDYMQGWCDESGFDDVEDYEIRYTMCNIQGSQSGGSIEIVEVAVDLDRDAHISMEGMSARGNQQGGSAVAFEYDVDLLQIVEFVDNGDGKYVPGDDEVINTYSLSGGWEPIRTSRPASGGVQFEADHPIGRGTFTISGKATGSSYSEGGVAVKPLDTKIDFIFSNVAYEVPDSQLAIVMHVESEDFASQGSSFGQGGSVVQSSESGIVGTRGGTALYFTWARTADVDGIAKPVKHHVDILELDGHSAGNEAGSSTVVEAEAGITLAYARGTEIIHDPRLGVQFNVKQSSPGLPLVGLVGLLAVLAVRRR